MDCKKICRCAFLLMLGAFSLYFSGQQKINIVFVGDSITQGEEEKAPPVFASAFLKNNWIWAL